MGPFCDFCSRKGHDASKCYKKRNKEKKQAFVSETSFCGTNQAFGVSTDWDQFLIDTAATSHFCYERDWFKNFKELKTTKALLADKKSTCEVEGIGDIDFIVKDIKVCILGWNHVQIDVKGAYLYGNLDIPIEMQQPEGFAVKGCEHYVCRLHKSIYGRHQSGRQWNIELNELLFGLGFHQNELCNGLYTKSNCISLVYVDDIVVFSKSQSDLEDSILNIKIRLEITELGPVRYLLGVNFERIGDSVYLHQNTYINKLKTRFKNLPRRRIALPLKVGCILSDRVKENEIIETELMRQIPYKTLIGCLSFIANRSRPDIAFAVNTMSQFCNGYTYHHWTIVVDILNYVFNTMYYKINLSDTHNTRLTMYSDSSWGCKLNDKHSTSGYIMLFGNVPITWEISEAKMYCFKLNES
ncbi:Retrovirus-related Pol polyprotein from transposon RE1 [Araneus ventricosus]|uniref:Retrovirus-related Pol polyprotein from transposon RE1 n=1 Tax=Araneus ventricosus TaxID=182803 RepID=A0A4Y2F1F0_ARAVE|nr:Retrovirus-related Pol polyprotein from transposon RE1 [Araneus ventricosus]